VQVLPLYLFGLVQCCDLFLRFSGARPAMFAAESRLAVFIARSLAFRLLSRTDVDTLLRQLVRIDAIHILLRPRRIRVILALLLFSLRLVVLVHLPSAALFKL